MKTVAIIPARLQSKRFPKKILYPIDEKPMVVHVYENVKKSESVNDVIVAVDGEPFHGSILELSNILSEDILSDYNLISADKGVIYWRSWWSKYGQRNSPTGTFGKAQKITKLPRHKLVDTWNSHTRFCKHCKNALKRYKKLKKFSQMGIIVGLFNRWRIFLAFSIATNIIANKIITIITGESIVNVQDRSYSAMKS